MPTLVHETHQNSIRTAGGDPASAAGWEGDMLQIWDVNWSLDEQQCPCDIHFTEWLERNQVKGRTIFHFGTGFHHHVGLKNHSNGSPNTILAITASPGEHAEFVRLATEHETLSRHYLAYFGDIYLMNPTMLPRFEIVTLFHLGEYRGDSQDAYGGHTDRQVTELLLDQMTTGGHVLLFNGSFAYDIAARIAGELVAAGRLVYRERYKSIEVYSKA
jgi:hypothetical protein